MTDQSLTINESTYRALREKILFGELAPGKPVTIRGLAQSLEVSPTPVRESVRRLIAERALTMHDNRRVSIPIMDNRRFQEIRLARLLLEPEMAMQAVASIQQSDIERLISIDEKMDIALENQDLVGYMRGNYEFHFTIYRLASQDVLLSLVESLWLQFGPYMRQVYDRIGRVPIDDQHRVATKSLIARDSIGFKNAIVEDLQQGMTFIGFDKP